MQGFKSQLIKTKFLPLLCSVLIGGKSIAAGMTSENEEGDERCVINWHKQFICWFRFMQTEAYGFVRMRRVMYLSMLHGMHPNAGNMLGRPS